MSIRKVLLVDDEADIRKIAALSLSRLGRWQVLEADCAARAVTLAARERPEVILLDVMMPGVDGIETFRKLQEAGAGSCVIFMTAKAQKHEVARYLALGAAGVIQKPFDPMTLPTEVRRIAEG